MSINWGKKPLLGAAVGIAVAANAGAAMAGQVEANAIARFAAGASTLYHAQCIKPDGSIRWEVTVPNIVVTAGLNKLLSETFKGSSYTATWYVGLVNNASFSAYAAADTMGSHGGWLEGTPYSNSNRPTLTLGTVSGGSVDNSGAVAAFTINATLTVRGAFIVDNNTKGGTTGTLYGAADFGAARSVISGDTLNVTATLTITAS